MIRDILTRLHKSKKNESDMKVCVLGAGIVGASTAWKLSNMGDESGMDRLSVDLVADSFSPATTTDVSAGFWLPFHWGGTTDEELQ